MASNRIPAPAGSVVRTVSGQRSEKIKQRRNSVMSKDDKKKEPTDIVKHEPTNLVDNFEGWEDSVEGDDRPQGGGIIQGSKIKFSNEAKWLQGDDEEMRPGLELIAVDLIRLVQMWGLD